MSVYLVRAFVELRKVLSTNRELARRFEELQTRLDRKLSQHDEAIDAILSAIPRTDEAGGIDTPRHWLHG
ncbi:MAG TPA: hypothetical protein VMF03_20885 [Steroidobacteraceae bacterium]|nr:hypothetical protein [Steroidobacteraceae bacterium]